MATDMTGPIAAREAPIGRHSKVRVKPSARLACEPLEGRELLSGMGGAFERERFMGARTAHVRSGWGGHGHRSGGGATPGAAATTPTTTAAGTSSAAAATTTDTSTTAATSTTPAANSTPAPVGWTGGAMGFRGRADFGRAGFDRGGSQAHPALGTQAQADLQKLQTDIQAIEAKSQVTVAELSAFRADLQAIGRPSGQPSSAVATAMQTLQKDEAAVLASGTFTSAQQSQLVGDFGAILSAGGATSAQVSKASTDLQAIITSSNVTSDDLARIAADQKAVQADLGTSGSSTANAGASGSTSANPAPNGPDGDVLAGLLLGQPGGPMGLGFGRGRGMFAMGGPPSTGGTTAPASPGATPSTGS